MIVTYKGIKLTPCPKKKFRIAIPMHSQILPAMNLP
jgi:hypothetical protein